MAGLNSLSGAAPSLNVPGMQQGGGGPISNGELMSEARGALAGNWGKVIWSLFLYFILISSVWTFFSTVGYVLGDLYAGAEGDGFPAGLMWSGFGLSLIGLLVTSFFTFGWFNYFRVLVEEGEARLDALFEGGRKIFSTAVTYLLLFGLNLVYQFAAVAVMMFLLNGNLLGMLIGFTIIQLLPIYLILRFSMVFFVLTDDDGYGAFGAMGRSSEITVGFKWKLFCLFFRFWILGILVSLPPFLVGLVLPMPFVVEYVPPQSLPILALASGLITLIGSIWLVPYFWTAFAKFYEDVR